jgi:putative flippase GtrA
VRTSGPRLLILCRREGQLVRGHVAVSLAGFAVDAALLYTSLASGLSAPWARMISLFWAMQTTFVLNGLYVFRQLRPGDVPRQWVSYMACNGVGNLANYLIFVGLAASRAPVLSNHYVALGIGGFTAWALNYCGARLLAFRAPALERARAPAARP